MKYCSYLFFYTNALSVRVQAVEEQFFWEVKTIELKVFKIILFVQTL